ncbi:MAG: RNA-binding protein [candidate division Zixibacteria bacterium]|nr:RNA-binding protein [candidate division Zixibacteria bacterium]
MQGNNLYVGNLSYSVTESQLKDLFSNHGEVKDVRVIDGKGFGFVEMTDTTSAEKAMEALNETEFEGRTLKVNEARPKNDNRRDNRGRGSSRY